MKFKIDFGSHIYTWYFKYNVAWSGGDLLAPIKNVPWQLGVHWWYINPP